MAEQKSLLSLVEKWVEDGLVSPDQAEAITAYEGLAERRRVSPRKILLYLGGLFVLMAVGFGLQVLWADLRWLGRVVVAAVPTLILWAVGQPLRRRRGPLPRGGAQALWMVAAWLTAILIAVTLVGSVPYQCGLIKPIQPGSQTRSTPQNAQKGMKRTQRLPNALVWLRNLRLEPSSHLGSALLTHFSLDNDLFLSPRWHSYQEEFLDRPDVVCQPCCHGGRALLPFLRGTAAFGRYRLNQCCSQRGVW